MMGMYLKKANVEDSERILEMQIVAFRPLLEKYKDYDTNPGAETLERVRSRFSYDSVDQYLIFADAENIGYIRVVRHDEDTCGLSQMFILPAFQGNGHAQSAIRQAESLYPKAKKWILRTIKQEAKLCHLYEKMGYTLNGHDSNIKQGMDLIGYAK